MARVVLPMPASPEIKMISRPWPEVTRLKASVSSAASESRPITPVRRPDLKA